MNTAQPDSRDASPPDTAGGWRALPGGIWVLGLGSLFMDMSSELVHALLPLLLTGTLGASMVTVGIIEGIAEATAAFTKVFSGVASDYFRRRKFLVVLGYGLAALTKPVFPLAGSVGWVAGARFVDRVGKGIRGAPRDALVADITPPALRGAAYGLRQALDTVGACIGPLLAVLCMLWLADNIRGALWLATLPALVAVTLLAVGIREPTAVAAPAAGRRRLGLGDAVRLPARYWLVVALAALFTLARFSEAFLILRAAGLGLALAYVPAIMVIMNVVYALVAYPAGAAADRWRASGLLIAGLAVLVTADAVLALATSPAGALLGGALWGLHMALTQGLFSKLVADNAPADLRGSAFGVFNLVSGGAMLLASLIAGLLWNALGPAATFIAGGAFAASAACGLLLYRYRGRHLQEG